MRFCPGLGCIVCGPAPGAAEPVPGGEQQGRLFRLRYSLLGNSLFVNIDRKYYFMLYSAPFWAFRLHYERPRPSTALV